MQNANKRFLTVNLKEPRGLDIVMQLAATADVLVENFRPGVAERLGLGYEAISARNPTLISGALPKPSTLYRVSTQPIMTPSPDSKKDQRRYDLESLFH